MMQSVRPLFWPKVESGRMDRAIVSIERGITTPEERVDFRARLIGVLFDEGDSLIDVNTIGRVFQLANKLVQAKSGQPTYRVSLLSRHGGHVASSSSITVWTQPLDAYSLRDFHAVFVASNDIRMTLRSDTGLAQWLSGSDRVVPDLEWHAQRLGGEQTSFLRPRVPVFWFGDADVTVWSSIRTAAQLALTLVATDHSEDISVQIARSLPPSVGVNAKPRLDDLRLHTAADKIRESMQWIKENYGDDISVSDAAAVAAMSVRNYLRRFKNESGMTPLEYLTRLRFEAICGMLTQTRLPVDKIARRCGMGNGDRLGRLFRKRYGVSPTAYRELLRTS
jgi:transcriptional regulator GlxA family with amidase domain